jgi:hypothetical protein
MYFAAVVLAFIAIVVPVVVMPLLERLRDGANL